MVDGRCRIIEEHTCSRELHVYHSLMIVPLHYFPSRFYVRGKDSIDDLFPQWNITEAKDKADLTRFHHRHC